MPSSNPFTRFLRGRLGSGVDRDRADAFVEVWDRLELLVIGVYRAGRASDEDERELAAIRAWMEERYPGYEADLEPYREGVEAAGRPLDADPFRALWERQSAASLVGDWAAMQCLPAARETLNRWLLSLR